ncbi:MAG: hypothetical protein LBD54_02650 [Puniceicoccales bacterium]|nr:hypothetical protein [Puniceicoccales bacterium]
MKTEEFPRRIEDFSCSVYKTPAKIFHPQKLIPDSRFPIPDSWSNGVLLFGKFSAVKIFIEVKVKLEFNKLLGIMQVLF